jgi:hypothetical protein
MFAIKKIASPGLNVVIFLLLLVPRAAGLLSVGTREKRDLERKCRENIET